MRSSIDVHEAQPRVELTHELPQHNARRSLEDASGSRHERQSWWFKMFNSKIRYSKVDVPARVTAAFYMYCRLDPPAEA